MLIKEKTKEHSWSDTFDHVQPPNFVNWTDLQRLIKKVQNLSCMWFCKNYINGLFLFFVQNHCILQMWGLWKEDAIECRILGWSHDAKPARYVFQFPERGMTNVIITRSDDFRGENKTQPFTRHPCTEKALIESHSLKARLSSIKNSKRISWGQKKFP